MNRSSPHTPSGSLRDRQREEAARIIVDAAELVISKRGLADASMAEIAATAGVAVGTVYNHYADRDALVAALFRARRAAIVPAIREAAEVRAGSFEAELRRFVRRVLEILEQHRAFVRIVFEARAGGIHDRSSRTTTVHSALRGVTEAVLARGHRAIDARTRTVHAPMLVGAIRAVVLEELGAGGNFSSHADALVDVFLDGARRR